MSLPQRIRRSFNRIAVLGLTGLSVSGCMADFVSPLSVASHRYPSAKVTTAAPRPQRPQQVDEAYVDTDRLPTAKEIFDLHPKGSDPGKMRQPFILDPHEGPLKISSLSAADAAAEDKVRLSQSETAARMALLRPVVPPAALQSAAPGASTAPLKHQ